MPPRSTPPPKGSFYPPNDVATYRDLLLFEERLKSNATNLQRRKARYQLFLVQLLVVIAFLLAEVLLPPQISLLAIPYNMVLQRVLPNIYTLETQVTIHPYFASGLLFVSVTTLVLFFASGMYSEKIAYANKYVPHANRALRSFNMYLNVRKPPLRSKFPLNPLAFFFPRPDEHSSLSPTPRPQSPARPHPRSVSPSGTRVALPIPSIPPASNPRGELIFSSRVDRAFRDAYERYRAAFERKREEKEREKEKEASWWRRWLYKTSSPTPARVGSPMVGSAPSLRNTSSSSSSGGTIGKKLGPLSRSGTPPAGRSGPSGGGEGGIMMRQKDSGSLPAVRDGTGTSPEPGSPEMPRKTRRERPGDDMRTVSMQRRLSHGDL